MDALLAEFIQLLKDGNEAKALSNKEITDAIWTLATESFLLMNDNIVHLVREKFS